MTHAARALVLAGLGALVIAAAILSLLLGTVPIGIDRLFAVLSGSGDPVATTILIDLRIPRTLVGLAVGAMLGLGGAVLQGYLRNPLADPGVLGTSSSAAFGAVLALYYGLAQLHPVIRTSEPTLVTAHHLSRQRARIDPFLHQTIVGR